jgi:hypothetical protein
LGEPIQERYFESWQGRKSARLLKCTSWLAHLAISSPPVVISNGCYFAEVWFNKVNSPKHLLDMKGALISFQKVTEWGNQA